MNPAESRSESLIIGLLGLIIEELKGDKKILEAFKTSLKYKVIEIDRDRAYNVYKIRRDLRARSITHLREFDSVLEALSHHEDEKVLIHSFHMEEGLLLFFSTVDCKKLFGYISYKDGDEGFV
ncbi:hypothetical protein [Chitinophaga ginsengisoli]|uniref:Uncharacterized protein n=1 Tax=Chitinophaga ginsengisoli TaxID=363837 RepID=A0A2P8FQK7_9BACT|nr:hypothetical protein [Chitinophaga ginsengisoli]PSL24016.1 hypothetical protein CLV42_1162 [Chitinophaga ginsengisoli]